MAAPGGEVITLQLGPYSNCVGAHWWSLQEASRHSASEICSDVLFRKGRTLQGVETYTPRLIALELKGGAQVQSEVDEDEEAMLSTPAWRGNVTTHREESTHHGMEEEKPRLQGDALKGGAKRMVDGKGGVPPLQYDALWTEYLCAPLHPKSLCAVSNRRHEGVGSLDSFSQGQSLLRTASDLDEMEDRLHFFSEECDYLQGFHLLCDMHSGFSGVGSRMAELLHDEYPGRGIFGFGTCPVPAEGQDMCTRTYQLMNCLLCLAAMSAHTSIFCPLTVSASLGRRPGPPVAFPQLLYDATLQYHSSAILAVTLDTLTIPYRLSSSSLSLNHIADTLSFNGRKVMTASCSLPFPVGFATSLPDALLPYRLAPSLRGLSACVDDRTIFSQSVVLRGIHSEQQTSHLPAGTQPRSNLHSCTSGEEVLQSYLATFYSRSLNISHLIESPCSLGPTFPQFFSGCITKDGHTLEEPLPEPAVVGCIPVLAALRASDSLHQTLLSLCDEVTKTDIRRLVNFSTAGVEEDDFREALNDLRDLAQRYRIADCGNSNGD